MRLQTLKARYVFPVTAEPIRDGTVTLQGERIVGVGRGTQGEVRDLGNVALLPGLINAHAHLEFSNFPAPLGHPGIGFADWVERLVTSRREADTSPAAVEKGLRESVEQGVTCLGEIAQPDWQPLIFDKAPLDATVFLELVAPTPPRVEASLEHIRTHLEAATSAAPWRPGLSPHAPYSVRPELLSSVAILSASRCVPVAFHLAESREELELLRSGTGPLRAFLKRLGAWDPRVFPGGLRPLDYLRPLAHAHRALVVHGNYLSEEEIVFLARHADRMAVVYCPRTHAWFQHRPYPLQRLLGAGIPVALGTDSRASSPDLSLLAETRLVARTYPDLRRQTVLQLATLHGARALGFDHQVGSLEPGKRADLTVVALPDDDRADPHALLLDAEGPVVGRWYRGREEGPKPTRPR